ncbi:MAG: hypothetical protein AAF236_03695, partial [Verrucomicrobiota bacterium]
MRDPYAESLPEHDGKVSSVVGRVFIFLFAGLLCLPAVSGGWSNLSWRGDDLKEKLAAFEKSVESWPVFEWGRAWDASLWRRWLREGNQRVMIGRDGWLFYRPDLETIVGKGPNYQEPPAVSRAPVDYQWQSPMDVIPEFVDQLKSRQIDLIIVPVPTKPMIAQKGLGISEGTFWPQHWDEMVQDLSEAGATVVDLSKMDHELSEEDIFLQGDTHWTPRFMELSAKFVSDVIGVSRLEDQTTFISPLETTHVGDLVGMLDSAEGFANSSLRLNQVRNRATGELLVSDPGAETVLLGDSFVNIYHDPALGFGKESDEPLGAGFAAHLSHSIQKPLHVIAINGDGATGVRQAFAAMPDDVVRSKKQVIWVLSSRDLLLAEVPGRRAGISWRNVAFNAEPSTGRMVEESEEVIISGVLAEKSRIEDPGGTPYTEAVFSTRFESVEV